MLSKLKKTFSGSVKLPLIKLSVPKVALLIIAILVLYKMYAGYEGFDQFVMLNSRFDSTSGDVAKQFMPTAALFMTNRCNYCTKMMPSWKKLPNIFHGMKFETIDCDKNTDISGFHGISSYPTVRFFPNGLYNKEGAVNYYGPYNLPSFEEWLQKVDNSPNYGTAMIQGQ